VDESTVAAELGVRRTLAAYCHLCDDGEFGRLVELFTGDGVFVFRGDVVTGGDALERWFADRQPPDGRGKHLTVNTVVDVTADRARAVSDYLYVVATPDGIVPTLTGRYDDQLRRVEDRWLFERREATLMRARRH